MVNSAEIYIWDEFVGAVIWNEVTQTATFEFDRNFVSKGYELSPIKMPLNNSTHVFSFPELKTQPNEQYSTFKGLPGLLADSLPDRYGSQLIDQWLTQNGRLPGSMNPVEQLCFIGSRGMGALEFKPTINSINEGALNLELNSLVATIGKLLNKKESLAANLHHNEHDALTKVLKVGTSAGGARPKAVIAYNEQTGDIKSGQTVAPKGYSQWLIKLDGVNDVQFGTSHGYGRVEYAYYRMARDCGINMSKCQLLKENERAHFMTKRFDRDINNQKIHAQTFCAIQHFDYNDMYSYSYEQLFQTMRILKLTYTEAEEMFRRMTFNVLATNFDDHTKNFAFILEKDGKWKLSPAYDVCYSYDPSNQWVNQHSMSINGKRDDISKSDLMEVAKQINIRNAEDIISNTQSVVSNWKEYANAVKVPNVLIDLIDRNLIAHNFKL